jgi:type I restriction enzyme S subunit
MKIETFFEKLYQLVDAPNAVEKMRELVLKFAVQGRLVSQDASDEPAAELVKKIRMEKARRHSRPESDNEILSVEDNDFLFSIPDSWEWVGATFPAVMVSDFGKKVQTKEVIDEGLYPVVDQGKVFIRGYCNDPNRVIHVSEPIILFGDHTRETKFIDFDFVVGADGVKLLQPLYLDPRYYYLALRWLPLDSRGYSRHFKLLRAAVIPLPPLAEQARIVAKVNELMAVCDRLDGQLQERETRHTVLTRAALARFTEAPTSANLELLFHDSFTIEPADLRKTIISLAVQGKLVTQDPNDEQAQDYIERLTQELSSELRRRQGPPLPQLPTDSHQYEVPDSWTWARFRDVAIIASNLVNPKNYLDFKHLAPDNIEKGNGVLLPCATVREDKVISSNHRFYPGQIVYSKIRPNLAKVVIVNFDGLCSADMYPINSLIDVRYLHRYMLSEPFLIQAVKTDTRVAMPKINQNELNAIAVPVPPLAEQRRIIAKVDQLMALVDQLETQISAFCATGTSLTNAVVAELTTEV